VQAGVISHMTAGFPPCFVSDGNTGSYQDQAIDLVEKAVALGVRCEMKLYPKEQAILGHGFETGDSEYAREVGKLTLDFLDSLKKQENTNTYKPSDSY